MNGYLAAGTGRNAMKKTIAVLLTVLMTLSLLAACGKPADKNVEKADLIGTWRG